MSVNENLDLVAAWIGIDWSDGHHDIALREVGSEKIERRRIDSTPEALMEFMGELRRRFGSGKVAIGLEQVRGPLIHALLEHEFLILFPINPASLNRFRKAFFGSGAKSDPCDADLILELLEKHHDRLHAWKPDDEDTRAISRLVEARRKAVGLQVQLVERLRAELKGYFPQALDWAGENLASQMACEFLRRWPTLEAVRRARPSSLRQFYSRHHCRSAARIEERLEQIRRAVPLVTDRAIVETSALTVQMLIGQISALLPSIEAYDKQIEEIFERHPDAHLFESLPGSGAVLAPRLLSAFGTDRSRFASAADIQAYSGIAPVTEASGKSRWVHRRWAAPKFLLQTFHEFAGHSIRYSLWARAYYEQMRDRGLAHHAAIRSLAFKWIRIIWRCWQDGVAYDENVYLEALRKRGSPLVARVPLAA